MLIGGRLLTRVPVNDVRNLAGQFLTLENPRNPQTLKKGWDFLSSTLISSSQTLPEQFFQIVHKAQVIGGVATESPICCCAFDRN